MKHSEQTEQANKNKELGGNRQGQKGGKSLIIKSICARTLSDSNVSDSSTAPRTAACQALLFMEFSRQEYWSG